MTTRHRVNRPGIRIIAFMPRSSAQSDFVIAAPPKPVELPESADAVSLPRATWRTPFASKRATFWVYAFVALTLLALFVVTMIAGHIPSGG